MLRFVLVILAWLICVGGVAYYMRAREPFYFADTTREHLVPRSLTTPLDLELMLTFDPQPDPFALSDRGSGTPPGVRIRINDHVVAELSEGIRPGSPWLKKNIEGAVAGPNELYVEATPPVEESETRQAVRIRLFQDGRTVADHTFWNEGGEKVTGTLPFQPEPQPTGTVHGQ
jgi:hypothetical protein